MSLPSTDAGLTSKKKRPPNLLLDSGQAQAVEQPVRSVASQSSRSCVWHWEQQNWFQGQASFNF